MVNRYQDLLNAVPRGKFYRADGDIYPFRDTPHVFEFQTDTPFNRYQIFFNAVPTGQVVTDADGVAVVRSEPALAPGTYEIVIINLGIAVPDGEPVPATVTPDSLIGRPAFTNTITVRHYAAWHAAYADVLEEMDAEIDELDESRSIRTVTAQYIQQAYGQQLRQPRPSTFLHEDYRELLQHLRPAYRHFGGHPYGLEQAVGALTSVTPFRVPKHWRPNWILGQQLVTNGYFDVRTRVCEEMYAPAGANALSPREELPTLNRSSRFYIHPGLPNGVTTSGFRQPPSVQPLTVTIGTAGDRVIITGLDENGLAFVETVPDPSIASVGDATYSSVKLVRQVTELERTGGGLTASQVGLSVNRFIRILSVGDHNLPALTFPLTYEGRFEGKSRLSWAGGPSTDVDDGVTILRDIGRRAHAFAIVEKAGAGSSYAFDFISADTQHYHDRLYLDVDKLGTIDIDIGTGSSSATMTEIRDRINAAFSADLRYGASYSSVAFIITGTEGDNASALVLRSPNEFDSASGTPSSVTVLPGPSDASGAVLGLPRTSTRLIGAASGTSLSCSDTTKMPASNFDVRIRGLRRNVGSGSLYGAFAPASQPAVIAIRLTGHTFTQLDIGGYVRWVDDNFPAENNGIHRIVGIYDSITALIRHERADEEEVFLTAMFDVSTGDGALYWSGEKVTVTANNQSAPGTLTLEADVVSPWPIGAIVEMVSETPYHVEGTDGLGELEVEVDSEYRPLYGFGDSITYVNGLDATGGMRITSSRALFAGVVGETVTVTNATNNENNGDFVISGGNGTTTIEFTNLSGLEETSSFVWDVTAPSDVVDSVTVEGSAIPDGWLVTSVNTTVFGSNNHGESNDTAPGLIAPSRVILKSDGGGGGDGVIQFQINLPHLVEYRGLPLEAQALVQEHTEDGAEYKIEVSFDGSTFYEVVADSSSLSSLLDDIELGTEFVGPQDPFPVSGTFFVPYDAETCVLRMTRTPTAPGAGTMSIEQFTLRSETGTGLSTDSNTIPRSAKRSKFGELLYVWSAEPLTSEERGYLGVPEAGAGSTVSTPGHIDYITNAHGWWDRLDVSEYDLTPAPLVRENIRGVYDSVEWLELETDNYLTNLDAIVGTPPKVSYVRPSRATNVQAEELTLFDGGDGPGTARATLLNDSNHEGAYPQLPNTDGGTLARLYEVRSTTTSLQTPEGLTTVIPAGTFIPLPDTVDAVGDQAWEFTASNEIRINAPYYTPSSRYFLDYEILMRATTKPFEIAASGVDPADFVWLMDNHAFKRHDVTEATLERTQQAVFLADFTATLRESADTDVDATLERDNGRYTETVGIEDWSFDDNKTIRINSSAFDPDSVYSFTYTAKIPRVQSAVVPVLEWRSAMTEAALLADSVAWEAVENNQVVSPLSSSSVGVNSVNPWHQVRVTIRGVTDVRDYRLFSLGVKGIHLFGSSPNAPGIIVP